MQKKSEIQEKFNYEIIIRKFLKKYLSTEEPLPKDQALIKSFEKVLQKKIVKIDFKIETKINVIGKHFHEFRIEAIKVLEKEDITNFKEIKFKVIQMIDYHYLPEFASKLVSSFSVNLPDKELSASIDKTIILKAIQSKMFSRITKVISKWIINLELIQDIINRIKLYNLLDNIPKQLNISKNWNPSNSFQFGFLIKSYSLTIAMELISSFFEYLRPFFIGISVIAPLDITIHFVSKLLGFFGIILELNPHVILASASIGLLSYFGSFLSDLAQDYMNNKSINKEVTEIIKSFKRINTIMKDQIRLANVIILDILQNDNSDHLKDQKEKLSKIVNNLINPKSEMKRTLSPLPQWSESMFSLDYLKSKTAEDDWVLIAKYDLHKKKIKEENIGNFNLLKLSQSANESE